MIRTEPAPESLEQWYLGINPNGVVPSLDHDWRQRISARPAWQTGMALHMAGVR